VSDVKPPVRPDLPLLNPGEDNQISFTILFKLCFSKINRLADRDQKISINPVRCDQNFSIDPADRDRKLENLQRKSKSFRREGIPVFESITIKMFQSTHLVAIKIFQSRSLLRLKILNRSTNRD
jgi:hypothetical protein